jgi:hypothetical protein
MGMAVVVPFLPETPEQALDMVDAFGPILLYIFTQRGQQIVEIVLGDQRRHVLPHRVPGALSFGWSLAMFVRFAPSRDEVSHEICVCVCVCSAAWHVRGGMACGGLHADGALAGARIRSQAQHKRLRGERQSNFAARMCAHAVAAV